MAVQQGDDPWPGPPPDTNWREIRKANQTDIDRMVSRKGIEKTAFDYLINKGCHRDSLLKKLVAVQRSGIGEPISGAQLKAAEVAFSHTITHLHRLQNSQLRRELFDDHPEIANLIQERIQWVLRRVKKADHTLTGYDHPRWDTAVATLVNYVYQETGKKCYSTIVLLIAALPSELRQGWTPEAFSEWRKRHKELIAREPSNEADPNSSRTT